MEGRGGAGMTSAWERMQSQVEEDRERNEALKASEENAAAWDNQAELMMAQFRKAEMERPHDAAAAFAHNMSINVNATVSATGEVDMLETEAKYSSNVKGNEKVVTNNWNGGNLEIGGGNGLDWRDVYGFSGSGL